MLVAQPKEPASSAERNVRAEFQALISVCGVFPLSSRARIKLSGTDRTRWLNGMVTNNVRDLASGHGVYAFLLNPQGRILGDLYAYKRGDSLLIDTDQSQAPQILEIFDRYIIMDDVVVENVSDQTAAIGIAGPASGAVLRSIGIEPDKLQPLEICALTWQKMELQLVRGDAEKPGWFEIWSSAESASKVWNALGQAGGIPVSLAALELYRIALGIPRYGQDIRERDLPQETEQARALNFSKGCYIGQEIVERIRSRGAVHRKFTGFRIAGPLPDPGCKLQLEGKDVGEVTSAAALPFPDGNLNVALGYIRREAATPGKKIMVGTSAAEVSALPFIAEREGP
jgi:folate-binding protein YgfZ